MKRNKISIFLLFLTIITFLIGIFYFNSSECYSLFIRLIILLISFLPFLISIIAIVVFYKKKQRFNDIFDNPFIVKMGLISCIFLYYIMAGVLCILIELINPITDIKSYKKIVRDEMTYLPKNIPQNATNIQFYYSPAFLQAGEELHLIYKDDNMTKDLFMKNYQDKAILTSDKNNPNEEVLNKASSPLLENDDELNQYLIYLVKNKCDDSGQCNHNEYVIVAFNEKTKKLLYIYEDW